MYLSPPSSTVYSGQATVATPGTPVPLGADQTCRLVLVRAPVANTGIIYLGPPGVSSTTGLVVEKPAAASPAEWIPFPVDNVNKVWVDAASAGDKAAWVAFQ